MASASLSLLRRNWQLLYSRSRQMGWINSLRFRWIEFRNKYFARLGLPIHWPELRLHIPGYPSPIHMRTGTSDYAVLKQVFIDCEYAIECSDPGVIIDCGANVGYASVYFLTRYPNARVIAVEPDPANAAVCRKNLKPFGGRATLIESGVWSRACRLTLVPQARCDEWGVQVREALEGEAGDLDSIDLPSLMGGANVERIGLLKIDIEWSELELFKPGAAPWLGRIDNIAIELHDADCRRVFFEAIAPYRYDLAHSGELTLCTNIQPRSSTAAVSPGLRGESSPGF
jgi:FkbM family methyltransferase